MGVPTQLTLISSLFSLLCLQPGLTILHGWLGAHYVAWAGLLAQQSFQVLPLDSYPALAFHSLLITQQQTPEGSKGQQVGQLGMDPTLPLSLCQP